MRPIALALTIAAFTSSGAAQSPLTDQQIAAIIVKESRDAYYRGPPMRLSRGLGAEWLALRPAKHLQPAGRCGALLLLGGRAEGEDRSVPRRPALIGSLPFC